MASVGKKGGKHDRDKWRGSSITENLIICTFFCKLTVNSNLHTRGEFVAEFLKDTYLVGKLQRISRCCICISPNLIEFLKNVEQEADGE